MKKSFGKGFLGPIGDDLPSLIPLVFALILFFYAFTFAWNAFDQKSSSFRDTRTVLELAYIMRGNSYIRNFDKFSENCVKVQSSIRDIHFRIGLVPLTINPLSGGEHYNKDGEALQELFFDPPETLSSSDAFDCRGLSGEDIPKLYNVRFFPVALERSYVDALTNEPRFFVKPMLLVVITWK